METQCQAKNISDEQRCNEVATASNNLFCKFHAKQAYGLYMGYKRRNAELDRLTASPPIYLAQSKVPLSTQHFSDVQDESSLQDLHHHLFKRFVLLDRVIRARKLHESRFYSMNYDYGHQAYVDKLNGQKFTVLRALGRLAQRFTEISHHNEKWFEWIRQCQLSEEKAREKENAKVKAENALFRRNQKEVEMLKKKRRAKEDRKRQDAFLEEAYKQRMTELEEEDLDWDPIEDVVADERENYIDLIRHFLWTERPQQAPLTDSQHGEFQAQVTDELHGDKENEAPTESGGQISAKKKKKSKAKQIAGGQGVTSVKDVQRPDKDNIETQASMRQRLTESQEYKPPPGSFIMAGTIQRPAEVLKTGAPIAEYELDELMAEIVEIKQLLLCRLLLSHAGPLDVALQAESVEDFLMNPNLSESDLRDLCLKMEKPSLQEIRDACADLKRGDEEFDENAEEEEEEDEDSDIDEPFRMTDERLGGGPKSLVPSKWKGEREVQGLAERVHSMQEAYGSTLVDFGEVNDKGQYTKKKMRVKICGKYIWNYASETAMSRRGWLHFCIIAKDCTLFDAMGLCRTWDEFMELNQLTSFHYFPGSRWRPWVDHREKEQLVHLGLVPYAATMDADRQTVRHQTGSRSFGPRQHFVVECRNIICAYMKRNDPVSRRFIQYLVMHPRNGLILVRDAKTGKIITKPPEEHLWLARKKSGIGRAIRNDWEKVKRIDKDYFEEMDERKQWHFAFDDYYEAFIWDLEPGTSFGSLYDHILKNILKAHRMTGPAELHNPMEAILRTITRDRVTFRARDIRPGEQVQSIWDELHADGSRYVFGAAKLSGSGEFRDQGTDPDKVWNFFYNEGDAAEDLIVFEEHLNPNNPKQKFKEMSNAITKLENDGPVLARFVMDLDPDEELAMGDLAPLALKMRAILEGPLGLDDNSDGQEESESDRHDEEDREEEEDNGAEWEDYDDEADSANSKLGEKARQVISAWKGPRWNTGIEKLMEDAEWPWEGEAKAGEEESRCRALVQSWQEDMDIMAEVGKGTEEEFRRHMDRERAVHFKDGFHHADKGTVAEEQYREAIRLQVALETHVMPDRSKSRYCLLTLGFLNDSPGKDTRTLRDIAVAFLKMCPFFPNHKSASIKEFLDSEAGAPFKDSQLFRMEGRAKILPKTRSHACSNHRPDGFWSEWDRRLKSLGRQKRNGPEAFTVTDYPKQWEVALRPIVAKLYVAGILTPSYDVEDGYSHPSVALRESEDGPLDFFIDMRSFPILEHDLKRIRAEMDNWPDLRGRAREFAQAHPNAKFAVLRVWSNPYFWPCMCSYERRPETAFRDALDRPWLFKFVPKDMPEGEWSIHTSLEKQFAQFREPLKVNGSPLNGYFGKRFAKEEERVLMKRDIVLVMAEDEDECLRLATGATYAMQCYPWLREVDLWKSFVNVDIGFIEGLDKYWLE